MKKGQASGYRTVWNTLRMIFVLLATGSLVAKASDGNHSLSEGVLGAFGYAHSVSVAAGPGQRIWIAASVHMPGETNPLAKVYIWHSADGGVTWSTPRQVSQTPFDDVGAGLGLTENGTLLVNYSTSLGWALTPVIENPKFAAWWEQLRGMNLLEAAAQVNFWMQRSEDGGQTWSSPMAIPANPLAGARSLRDGKVFLFGQRVTAGFRQLIDGQRSNFLMTSAVSDDDGLTWEKTRDIPAVFGEGNIATSVHETGFAENDLGEIVVLTRNDFEGDGRDVFQFEILEGYGARWSRRRKVLEASSFHIASLQDGRLFLSYLTGPDSGTLWARTSGDGGRTWQEPVEQVSVKGTITPGFSSAELEDGRMISAWFEKDNNEGLLTLQYRLWKH